MFTDSSSTSWGEFFFYIRGSMIPLPVCRFLLQTGSNTSTINRHHCHHYPTLCITRTPEPIP
jgi:hypothetical protein